jgi:hypothetical protein
MPITTHEISGRTPTMLGVWCTATGPLGLTCIYGADHAVDYHQSPQGQKWGGGPRDQQIPITLTVGHLQPAVVGTITTGDGATCVHLGALLREIADVLDPTPEVTSDGVMPEPDVCPECREPIESADPVAPSPTWGGRQVHEECR